MGNRKDKSSKRSLLFKERNSLEYCEEHVRDLLDVLFKIKNYEIKEYEDNGKALFIYDAEDTYIVFYDEEYVEVKLVSSKDNFKSYKNYVHNDGFKQAIKQILIEVGE